MVCRGNLFRSCVVGDRGSRGSGPGRHGPCTFDETRQDAPDRAPAGLVLAVVLITVLWPVALLAAPVLAARNAPGAPVVFASTLAYVVGGVVCHQLPDRSFSLAGVQLPVCARCTALYVAAPFGLLAGLLVGARRRPGATRPGPGWWPRMQLALFIAAVPTVMTVGVELTGLAHPSDMLRAVASAPLGVAVAGLVGLVLRGETVWYTPSGS